MLGVEQRTGGLWCVFGDSAFALSRYVQRMLKGAARYTQRGRYFNRRMGAARVSIENDFGALLAQWPFIGHKLTNQIGQMPLTRQVVVAAFLHNCQAIWYGSLLTETFDDWLRDGETVESYIGRAQA